MHLRIWHQNTVCETKIDRTKREVEIKLDLFQECKAGLTFKNKS